MPAFNPVGSGERHGGRRRAGGAWRRPPCRRPCRSATAEAGGGGALPSPSAGCPPMMTGDGHLAAAPLETPWRWEGGGGRCWCRWGGASWLRAAARPPALRRRRVPVPGGACLSRCTRRVNLVDERVGTGRRGGGRGVPPLRRPPHGRLPHRIVRTAGSAPPLPANHAAATSFLHPEKARPSLFAARAPPHARRCEVGTDRSVACPCPAAAPGRHFRADVVLKSLSRSSLAVAVSDRLRRRAELRGTEGSSGRILGVA